MKSIFIFALFALITATAGNVIAQGAEQSKDVPVGGMVYNECCQEWVMVSGLGHVVIRKGSFSTSHIDIKGMTGTGENGRAYTQKAATVQNLNLDPVTGEGSQIFHIKMTGPDGCSFTLHMTMQYHLNANGDLTADVTKTSTTCE
jgi:hypothetical protein